MSRRLSVSLLPGLHPPEQRGGTALVIDVLRATTTATTFLERGADAVMFAPSIEAAHALRASLGTGTLLAGERGGLRIDGFDLGNSPLDAAAREWGGHTLVMNTTNGTDAAHTAVQAAQHVLLACLRNAPAAAARAQALAQGGDITVVCAGTDGQVSLDDCYTAGVVVRELLGPAGETDFMLNDSAQMVLALTARWPGPQAALQASAHGQRLLGMGDIDLAFADLALDVTFCAELGVSDCVPELRGREAEGLVFR
ncbi:putative 2-phosphosulfolactate phosphatase [Deinococcus piscis]|uniref:Probable 2-phosphosulfolactate phosphatase n=1 Tax=Deinococcus piscis TaxID=394230 RepID=A0ABQ3JYM4_9DEIO|nr:2-phosphosulfolactate phosphatase [Deinococcus piscis]GHF95197.1 putative 2-phosphosulfolactate phosphatase [Deinococcus piscis]